jgi:hypothetical protein
MATMPPSSTMMTTLPRVMVSQWPAVPMPLARVNTARARATWFRLKAATRMKDRVLAKRLMPVSRVSMEVTSTRSPRLAWVSIHL